MTALSIVIVLLFGIAYTVQLHISRGLQKQGIEVFDQIRAKIKKEEGGEKGAKKPVIYTIGLVLNNTVFVYQWLSQHDALNQPPALFTSMLGIGLIALMLYSYFVLKEPVSKLEIIGSIILIVGTLVIGIEAFFRPAYEIGNLNTIGVLVTTGVFLAFASIALGIVVKKRSPSLGLVFGLVSGVCAGLDTFFKGAGIQESGGGGGLLPITLLGWITFLLSFVLATYSFLVSQWGFARKARANVLVPSYNATFVIVPILYQMAFLPGFLADVAFIPSTAIGVGLIIIGMYLIGRELPATVVKKPIAEPEVADGVEETATTGST